METTMTSEYPLIVIDNNCKYELGIKRCYLPVRITDKCFNCGVVRTVDLDSYYVSYPTLNMAEPISFYCENCDHEWDVNIVISLNIKLAEKVQDD